MMKLWVNKASKQNVGQANVGQTMVRTMVMKILVFVGLVSGMFMAAASAQAFEPFQVDNIRVEGNERITPGTVFNYTPLTVGETLTVERAQTIMRALYETDFFTDVQLSKDGSTLVVEVAERPTIVEFSIQGNDAIGGEELEESLRVVGLDRGKVYKESMLDQVRQELLRQYFSNGFYGVLVNSEVSELDNNRVRVKITIDEGDIALIQRINVVGNTVFDDDTILENFTLVPTGGFGTWFSSDDQYSRQKLLGDVETLNSFYQDQGYLKFRVDSAQVSVAPNREDVYITINVDEGDIYTIKDFEFSGELLDDEPAYRNLLLQSPGEKFSRARARQTADRIKNYLGESGYAFAKVDPSPILDDDNKQVSLVYVIEPGKRVYVRRIDIAGNLKTNDETLRRELRLLEGGLFKPSKLSQSRARLQRLAFVENLDIKTRPVAGSNDLIDVSINISERAPGNLQLGIGYSESQGFLVNSSVSHSNWLGTGSRLTLEANRNELSQNYRASYSRPYINSWGMSRTVSGFYRQTDGISTDFTTGYTTDALGASLTYGLPVTEHASFRFGLSYRDTAIFAGGGSSDEVLRFIDNNGSRFNNVTLRTGLTYNRLNRSFFADRGAKVRLGFDVSTPLGDLEFYESSLDYNFYVPLGSWFTLEMDGRVAYSDVYGETSEIPPYERFFAGGVNSVRGYDSSSLGPRDSFDDPLGGQFLVVNQAELILPSPLESNNKSTRFVLFVDAGNTFNEVGDFNADEIRTSAGVAAYWMTPILGVLKFSYAVPLNEQVGDEVDRFQFTFGVDI